MIEFAVLLLLVGVGLTLGHVSRAAMAAEDIAERLEARDAEKALATERAAARARYQADRRAEAKRKRDRERLHRENLRTGRPWKFTRP